MVQHFPIELDNFLRETYETFAKSGVCFIAMYIYLSVQIQRASFREFQLQDKSNFNSIKSFREIDL